jgi:putative ABC transport system permease protein
MTFWRKLRSILPSYRAARERDMHDELESLKAMAGRNELGNLTLVAEDARRVWTAVWIEQLLQDLRYALRTLRRSPGFTVVVILTLALAIGMSTSVFSVLNAVLLRPISYPNGGRLLWVTTFDKQWNEEWVSAWDFKNWQEQATSFDGMVSYDTLDLNISTPQGLIPTRLALVSQDFWKLSGARPALGRLPVEGEEHVIVLSNGLFERWLHSDVAAIGKVAVEVEDRPHTVIGVLPRDFRFEFPAHFGGLDDENVDFYGSPLPYGRGRGVSSVVGSLKPGISIDRARGELAAIRQRIAADNPRREATEMELRVIPLLEKRTGHVYTAVWLLFGAVLFVLFVACANIANLLLARASVRQKEISIRGSLGAGPLRVLRQFLVESSLLVLAGGLSGLLLARGSIALIVRLSAKALPRLPEATMDFRVLLFALGASILPAILFGLTPMIALGRTNLQYGLKDAAKGVSTWRGGLRARRLLVACELAFALVLLAGAGLMVKSFLRMYAHPDGFEPENILVMKIELSGPRYFGTASPQKAYVDEALRRIRPIPGVRSATVIVRGESPLEWENMPRLEQAGGEPPLIAINGTSAEFADVMGTRLVKGRWFKDGEQAMVINESLARRDFGSVDPIGKRIDGIGPVVGILSDLKYIKLDQSAEPEVYLPFSPTGRGDLLRTSLVVRTAVNPMTIAPILRKLVAEIDKSQPAFEIQTLEQVLADSIAPRRFNLILLGTFAATALLLALIGIYGVTAYSVAQRTHEIGIRITLGARPREVVGMMVRQGMVMALVGLLAGLPAAAGLTRLMTSILYDVEPTDTTTFAITALALCATALLACWLPSRKAALVDPNVALRYE